MALENKPVEDVAKEILDSNNNGTILDDLISSIYSDKRLDGADLTNIKELVKEFESEKNDVYKNTKNAVSKIAVEVVENMLDKGYTVKNENDYNALVMLSEKFGSNVKFPDFNEIFDKTYNKTGFSLLNFEGELRVYTDDALVKNRLGFIRDGKFVEDYVWGGRLFTKEDNKISNNIASEINTIADIENSYLISEREKAEALNKKAEEVKTEEVKVKEVKIEEKTKKQEVTKEVKEEKVVPVQVQVNEQVSNSNDYKGIKSIEDPRSMYEMKYFMIQDYVAFNKLENGKNAKLTVSLNEKGEWYSSMLKEGEEGNELLMYLGLDKHTFSEKDKVPMTGENSNLDSKNPYLVRDAKKLLELTKILGVSEAKIAVLNNVTPSLELENFGTNLFLQYEEGNVKILSQDKNGDLDIKLINEADLKLVVEKYKSGEFQRIAEEVGFVGGLSLAGILAFVARTGISMLLGTPTLIYSFFKGYKLYNSFELENNHSIGLFEKLEMMKENSNIKGETVSIMKSYLEGKEKGFIKDWEFDDDKNDFVFITLEGDKILNKDIIKKVDDLSEKDLNKYALIKNLENAGISFDSFAEGKYELDFTNLDLLDDTTTLEFKDSKITINSRNLENTLEFNLDDKAIGENGVADKIIKVNEYFEALSKLDSMNRQNSIVENTYKEAQLKAQEEEIFKLKSLFAGNEIIVKEENTEEKVEEKKEEIKVVGELKDASEEEFGLFDWSQKLGEYKIGEGEARDILLEKRQSKTYNEDGKVNYVLKLDAPFFSLDFNKTVDLESIDGKLPTKAEINKKLNDLINQNK